MKYLKRIIVKDEFDDGGEKGNIRGTGGFTSGSGRPWCQGFQVGPAPRGWRP